MEDISEKRINWLTFEQDCGILWQSVVCKATNNEKAMTKTVIPGKK